MWRIVLFILIAYIPLCQCGQIESQFYHAVNTYVDCCCFTFSKEQFEEILDQEVQLFHQTNEEPPFIAKGKETVSELFNKYVFDNSFDVELKELNIKPKNNETKEISLKLLVEETKTTDGIFSGRFLFEECTNFQFSDTKPHKIISIHMQVERQLISNRF